MFTCGIRLRLIIKLIYLPVPERGDPLPSRPLCPSAKANLNRQVSQSVSWAHFHKRPVGLPRQEQQSEIPSANQATIVDGRLQKHNSASHPPQHIHKHTHIQFIRLFLSLTHQCHYQFTVRARTTREESLSLTLHATAHVVFVVGYFLITAK